MRLPALIPLSIGMEISRTTTSGASWAAASTAACPSPTAATTSQQSAERRARTYSRICWVSPASNTRIFDKLTPKLTLFVQKIFLACGRAVRRGEERRLDQWGRLGLLVII